MPNTTLILYHNKKAVNYTVKYCLFLMKKKYTNFIKIVVKILNNIYLN